MITFESIRALPRVKKTAASRGLLAAAAVMSLAGCVTAPQQSCSRRVPSPPNSTSWYPVGQ